jgi:hypothetical protein
MVGRARDARMTPDISLWFASWPCPLTAAVAAARIDAAGAQLENHGWFAILQLCEMKVAGERALSVPARNRNERCRLYEFR